MLSQSLAGSAPSASTLSPESEPPPGLAEHVISHTCDADCAPHLDAEGLGCAACGVSWAADGCTVCGGHAYHVAGCSQSDDYEPPTTAVRVIRHEVDGDQIAAIVEIDGRREVLTATIDTETDGRGGFHFASLTDAPSWTSPEQDEAIEWALVSAWQSPPMRSAFPHTSIEDVADHWRCGETQQIPAVSMREIADEYWREHALKAGAL